MSKDKIEFELEDGSKFFIYIKELLEFQEFYRKYGKS
jgi:hypothetical protein